MLKHRNIVILFLLLFSVLILMERTYHVPGFDYVLLLILFSGIEFYGAYFIHSDFHLNAICKSDTSEKIIALSFDDGPAAQTKKILDVLAAHNVKATFFCIGKQIEGKEAILKEIDAAGHTIGNHSYSHGVLFDLKTTSGFVSDLSLCNATIQKVTGKTPAFFRPPYGVTTPGLARATRKLGLQVIGWNIRSLDTSIKDKQRVISRIKKRLKPGSILLLHDTVAGTELVLEDVLRHLKEQHYTVVPLDQLIQKKAYV